MARYDKDLTKEQLDGRERLHNLIAELGELIGPKGMVDIDPDLTEEEREELGGDVTTSLINGWVLVMNWTDINDGESYITRLCSENMPSHVNAGLLYEALNNFD